MLTAQQINEIYQAVLYRPASAAAEAYWLSVDSQSGDSATIADIINSKLAKETVWPVIRIADLAFGFFPTESQIATLVDSQTSLGGSLNFKQLTAELLESAKFNAYYGFNPSNPNAVITNTAQNQAFITQVWEYATGQPPTAADMSSIIGHYTFVNFMDLVANHSSDFLTVTNNHIQNFLTAEAEAAAGIIVTGQTYNLTTGVDDIVITTPNTLDTVNGIIDTTSGSTDSTYTVGDTVQGNGYTVVKLAVEGSGANTNAALATLEGVQVDFLRGFSGDLNVNAALWSNVNNVQVTGEGGGDINVNNLTVNDGQPLKLAITTTKASYLTAHTGHISGLNFYAKLESGAGVGTVASFGQAGITATVGKAGYLELSLYQSVDNTAGKGAASVGDISIGNISVNIGESAEVDGIYVYNYAVADGHDATVGNIAVGNVNVTDAQKGDGYLEVYNEAYVDGGHGGNAVAGNFTVGNITLHETGKTGSLYAEAYNEAYAYGSGTHNATVGNVTVGNVSLAANDYGYLEVYNYAYADGSAGNATAGNVTVGNIAIVDGTKDYIYAEAYNEAYAYKGNATVGNVTAGNVSVTAGYEGYVEISNYAYVGKSGNATAGNVAVGNLTLSATKDADAYAEVYNEVYVESGKAGVAAAGNVTVGNLSLAAASGDAYAEVYNYVYNYATKTGGATAGNVTVGNVTLSHNPNHSVTGGYNYAEVYNEAYAEYTGNAKAGNITVGNIAINPAGVGLTGQTGASNYLEIYNDAYAPHGVATVGTVTVGNITGVTGASGELYVEAYNYADGKSSADSAGLVTVGNVSMHGAAKADMYLEVYNYANSGNAAGINIGNVSIVGTKALGTAGLDVYITAGNSGKISIGNIAVADQNVYLEVENKATTGAAGGITIGNISLTGAYVGHTNYVRDIGKVGAGNINVGNVTWGPQGTAQYFDVKNYATGGNAGNVNIGNVSFGVGKDQLAKFSVLDEAPAGKVGGVTVGNVSLAVANTNATTKAATAEFYVDTTGTKGGSIAVGNITIGSSGVTTKAALAAAEMAGHVTITSEHGNVTVGNITVTGGVLTDAGTVVSDNFNTVGPGSTWLDLSAPLGTVTVGNVDYSGYASAATINVQGYLGAPAIIGAQGGSTITDNSGTNAIDVSHTTKADTIYLQPTQNGVSDSGGAITAPQATLDSITGIHSGDAIEFSNGAGAGLALTGTTIVQGGALASYSVFLHNAEIQIDTNGNAAYIADVGSNTFVAMNDGGHVTEIVEVMGIHTFTLSGGELHYLT